MTYRMGRSSCGRAHRVVIFAVFSLLALCLPGAALAQWATSGGNTISTNTGNVGVGTSTPQAKLDVQGSSTYNTSGIFSAVYAKGTADYPMALMLDGAGTNDSMARLRALNNGATKWQLNFGDDLIFYRWTNTFIDTLALRNNGNVGIGTTAPVSKLQVSGAGGYETAGAAEFRIQNTAWGGSFVQHVGNTGNWQLADTTTGATKLMVSPGLNGAINLYNGTGNVIINGKGNVGIGTSTPAAALDVVGSINVSGNINAKYQDVAEWVPSKQKLAAGTVVVLDTAELNHVAASGKSYDTGVAGVVSAQPGIALGEKAEGKVLVATTGRVKVKVDATRAPINVGDLLVTSDVAGVAMKSEPVSFGGVSIHRPGTIIGKALEPLAGGTGEILVLLSLQ